MNKPLKKCPSCGKSLTPTEEFFGECQVCSEDLDALLEEKSEEMDATE